MRSSTWWNVAAHRGIVFGDAPRSAPSVGQGRLSTADGRSAVRAPVPARCTGMLLEVESAPCLHGNPRRSQGQARGRPPSPAPSAVYPATLGRTFIPVATSPEYARPPATTLATVLDGDRSTVPPTVFAAGAEQAVPRPCRTVTRADHRLASVELAATDGETELRMPAPSPRNRGFGPLPAS